MTARIRAVENELGPDVRNELPGVPEAERVVAPESLEEVATVMRTASAHGLRVLLWGGGTHRGFGYPVEADVVLSTAKLTRVIDWQPEDLTIVVEGGLRVADLEALLADRGQSAMLPERPGEATVGGVVAAGVSGWRRLRYGPTRDRMLEVVLVTGDGRTVTAGGRVVKNVTGYDIPKLATGSLGSLGVIGSVCLKLWPVARHAGTIPVDDAAAAHARTYRPLSVIETESGANVFVAGTAEEVAGHAADLGSEASPGLAWPEPLDTPWVLSARVPPALLAETIAAIRSDFEGLRFQAAHGVGTVAIGLHAVEPAKVLSLRARAEACGGALVVERTPEPGAHGIDPWGAVPSSVDLQRRIKAAFDPAGICNAGRLPGRI